MYFEPWGTEHILVADDVFTVASSALASGDLEVSFVEGGIALTFTADVPIFVTDDAGRRWEV